MCSFCGGSICTRVVHFPVYALAVQELLIDDFSLPQRFGPRVLDRDWQHAAFGGSRVPRAAAFCVAVVYSTVQPAFQEATLGSLDAVCMVETSSDGRERLCMMVLCQVRVVGSVGWSPIGL